MTRHNSMPRKTPHDIKRKRRKDKKREHYNKNGKFTSKHLRVTEALIERKNKNKK